MCSVATPGPQGNGGTDRPHVEGGRGSGGRQERLSAKRSISESVELQLLGPHADEVQIRRLLEKRPRSTNDKHTLSHSRLCSEHRICRLTPDLTLPPEMPPTKI